MNAAFEIGAAALRAEQKAMEILANNVANVNTPAFKRSEARFAEVLAREAQSPDRAEPAPIPPMRGGSGVRVAVQEMLLTQGEIRATGNALDLAIDGQGMIELVGPGGESLFWRGGRLRVNAEGLLSSADGLPTYYTRTGSFVVDEEGYIVKAGTEYRLATLDAAGRPVSLNIDNSRTSPPLATTRIEFGDNLSSTATTVERSGRAIQFPPARGAGPIAFAAGRDRPGAGRSDRRTLQPFRLHRDRPAAGNGRKPGDRGDPRSCPFRL